METYDYVIVGAGSAGCALANRLSEDPTMKVCLVEAGKKDNALMVRMPAGVGNLIKAEGAYNWGFWTEPQKHMNGRKLWWPRGKGWGGSSSINGMIYIRGHARDYDQWAQIGLRGWSFADVLPYFRKSEGYEGGDSAYHGASGPLKVSESPLSSPIYRAFLQAGEQAGYASTKDFNGAEQEGFGRYQRTIHKGERWSASYGYLRPIVGVRDNLTVISTGLVTRILMEKGRATGVEVVEGKGRLAQEIHASSEVIVCAGAVQSPQLLQLSGIGNPDHLGRFDIKTEVKSPNVGQNLQDHLDLTVGEGIRGERWTKKPWLTLPDGSPDPRIQVSILPKRIMDLCWRDRATTPHPGDTMIVDMDLGHENLPVGTRLQAGSAVLEVSDKFNTGCTKWRDRYGQDSLRWINRKENRPHRLRGILCKIVQDGPVRVGDQLAKL